MFLPSGTVIGRHCRLGKRCLFVHLPFASVYQPALKWAALAGRHVLIENGSSPTLLSKAGRHVLIVNESYSTLLSKVSFSAGALPLLGSCLPRKEQENHYF